MSHIQRTHHIGLLTPSSNTVEAPEFTEVLPRNVALHSGRLGLRTIDADSTIRIVEELEQESRKLGGARRLHGFALCRFSEPGPNDDLVERGT